MKSKILLPFAHNASGELVHIDSASKSEAYYCPSCGAELVLKISKIPEGQKYHRSNHFAHKSASDNSCSESFLHKMFKEKIYDYIKSQIEKTSTLDFQWICDKCGDRHEGNLLKKAVSVKMEYDLGDCRPDIALLDKNGQVVIVIEVVVSHRPSEEAMKYYNSHKIACVQIDVSDFSDCENVEEKLKNPNRVNICSSPICEKCGGRKRKAKMYSVQTTCWSCGKPMFCAMISPLKGDDYEIVEASKFTNEDINMAKEHLGVIIGKCYSKTLRMAYYANLCGHCQHFLGKNYMHELFDLGAVREIEIGHRCFNCYLRESLLENV